MLTRFEHIKAAVTMTAVFILAFSCEWWADLILSAM